MSPLKLLANFKYKMFFNGSILFSMDVAFDHEIFPPPLFVSNKGKVYINVDVSVVILLLGFYIIRSWNFMNFSYIDLIIDEKNEKVLVNNKRKV
jgi:hypothetical protein